MWNFESHMQFAGMWAAWKVTNGAENLLLQALLFQKMGVGRALSGGACVTNYWSNEHFVEG